MMKRKKLRDKDYEQVIDGEVYEWGKRKLDIACCHCALVHTEELWIEDGKIMCRTRYAKRKTDDLRKDLGIFDLMKQVLTGREE